MAFDLKAWILTHKPQAALGAGAAGAVGIGLYRKRKTSSPTVSNDQVPTSATTASVAPYGGSDVAGGIPYDPSAFSMDPSGYAAQISQGISDLQTTDAAIAAGVATIATNTTPPPPRKIPPRPLKPTTGGTITKPAKSPKPTKKPPKHPPAKATPPAPPPPARNTIRPAAGPRQTQPIRPAKTQPRRRA